MSILTYNYRIKDQISRTYLPQMASATNYVWNYCNEVSLLAYRRDKTFLSAYDLHKLTAGTSKDLRMSADTIPASLYGVRHQTTAMQEDQTQVV